MTVANTPSSQTNYCAFIRLMGAFINSLNCTFHPTTQSQPREGVNVSEGKGLAKTLWTKEQLLGFGIENGKRFVPSSESWALYFYTFATPVFLVIGLVGNSLCMVVFMRRRMRKQASSYYLAALALSDQLVLIFYVTPEWFKRGLSNITDSPQLRLLGYNGVCHIFLYLSYTFRFQAVWMMVAATLERYLAVFHPMLRNQFRSRFWTTRIIITIVTVSSLVSLWKPATSRVERIVHPTGFASICTSMDGQEVFIADTIYAASISVLPSLLLLVFNSLISRRLFVWRRGQEIVTIFPQSTLSSATEIHSTGGGISEFLGSQNRVMGVQFAAVLISVSFVSLLLTWPYYICWIVQWRRVYQQIASYPLPLEIGTVAVSRNLLGSRDGFYTAMYITRVLFYLNYSVNFFLYNLTGRFFRSELRRIIWSTVARGQPAEAYSTAMELLPSRRMTDAMTLKSPEERVISYHHVTK